MLSRKNVESSAAMLLKPSHLPHFYTVRREFAKPQKELSQKETALEGGSRALAAADESG